DERGKISLAIPGFENQESSAPAPRENRGRAPREDRDDRDDRRDNRDDRHEDRSAHRNADRRGNDRNPRYA
ncbi:hypothetical protein, partial [Gardnerella vaginalis]|uniref:hypothetical protein n=1 Tax=Gardnerella vaginalis TaxID=2702 RepID=UPI0039F026F4